MRCGLLKVEAVASRRNQRIPFAAKRSRIAGDMKLACLEAAVLMKVGYSRLRGNALHKGIGCPMHGLFRLDRDKHRSELPDATEALLTDERSFDSVRLSPSLRSR